MIYGLIERLACKTKPLIDTISMSNETPAQWRITMMMGQIILLYGICWIPILIIDQLLSADLMTINYMRYHNVTLVVYSIATCVIYIFYC